MDRQKKVIHFLAKLNFITMLVLYGTVILMTSGFNLDWMLFLSPIPMFGAATLIGATWYTNRQDNEYEEDLEMEVPYQVEEPATKSKEPLLQPKVVNNISKNTELIIPPNMNSEKISDDIPMYGFPAGYLEILASTPKQKGNDIKVMKAVREEILSEYGFPVGYLETLVSKPTEEVIESNMIMDIYDQVLGDNDFKINYSDVVISEKQETSVQKKIRKDF